MKRSADPIVSFTQPLKVTNMNFKVVVLNSLTLSALLDGMLNLKLQM